jgi:hypothetical protein
MDFDETDFDNPEHLAALRAEFEQELVDEGWWDDPEHTQEVADNDWQATLALLGIIPHPAEEDGVD